MATMRNKRNSMPSLGLGFNRFMVSKRASMFENQEETPQEKRDRSPCGILEVSERKLEARKEVDRKKAAMARKKKRADPYADQSSAPEDDIINSQIKRSSCKHINASVSSSHVRKALKSNCKIGTCSGCAKLAKATESETLNENLKLEEKKKVGVWMCLLCAHQGCGRDSHHEHAYNHYTTPRSANHCIVLSTEFWDVWCYECNSEVFTNSNKMLNELINMIKRKNDLSVPSDPPPSTEDTLAPLNSSRSRSAVRSTSPAVVAGRARGSSANIIDEKMKQKLDKIKGLPNLGNTCYLNSVLQVLSQTRLLTDVFDLQLQSGQRTVLQGLKESPNNNEASDDFPNEPLELKPIDLMLPEGGPLSVTLSTLMKDLNGASRTNLANPSHLLGQISKKNNQFRGNYQQDAHELLRCLLECLRVEEIHRAKRAILKAFGLNEKTDPSKVNQRMKQTIQAYGRQANHTIIDQIFGGQLISTVVCEECHSSSQVFEPFMDLSISIAEEKGKPKSFSGSEENLFDSFGKPLSTTAKLSKHQLKKQKKLARKNRRNNSSNFQGKNNRKSNVSESDKDVIDLEQCEEVKKRLTELRKPGEEALTSGISEREDKQGDKKAIESKKYKWLMNMRKEEMREEKSGGDSSDESEELEYDQEEESEGVTLDKEEDDLDSKKKVKNILLERLNSLTQLGGKGSVDIKDNNSEEEEEEEEEESEDEEDDETSSSAQEITKKHSASNRKENNDADEEDNAESEWPERITRQPSIVVVDHSEDNDCGNDAVGSDNRYLSTSASCDQLNYNSASDTSERYFTADGIDDDLEGGSRTGMQKEDYINALSEGRIQRKSSSKESLYKSTLRGSEHYRSLDKLKEVEEEANSNCRKFKQEWLDRSLTPIAPKYQPVSMECSVMSGLAKFTAPEILTNKNKIYCENCTKLKNIGGGKDGEMVRSSARKQMMIVCPPAVLTLQIKRYHGDGRSTQKENRFVHFPLVLDLAPFTSTVAVPPGNNLLYGLYGIVQHAGRLSQGHYTAIVRKRDSGHATSTSNYLVQNLLENSSLESDPPPRIKNSNNQNDTTDKEQIEKKLKESNWYSISDAHVSHVNIEKVLKSQAYLLFYERLL